MTLEKFQQKFQVQVPFTTYYGLINSIPSSWRRELKATNSTNTKDNCPQVCSNKNFATKSVYAAILDYFYQAPTAESKILRYGFSKEFLKKVFQYKIIPSILPSRCSLFRAKLSECDTCRVCHSASERNGGHVWKWSGVLQSHHHTIHALPDLPCACNDGKTWKFETL